MAKKYSGIEIGPSSITIAQLSVSGSDIRVSAFEEIPLAGRTAKELLSELWNGKKLSEGAICTGISAHKVFFRESVFPFSDKNKIRQALPFTLSDTLPFPLEEASYSCFPFERDEGKTTVKSLVVRKASVAEAQSLFPAPHLLSIITAESTAVSEPFVPSGIGTGAYMAIHIGREHAILTIMKEGAPIFTRTLTKGMKSILSDLAGQTGISEAEAEELLCSGESSLEEEKMALAEKSVKGFFNTFIREMELSIRSFGFGKGDLSALMLTGDGSEIKGIGPYLEDKMAVKVASPVLKKDLALDPGVKLTDLITKGTVALGYALLGAGNESINFAGKKFRFAENNLYKALYANRKLLAVSSGILLLLYTLSLAVSVTYHKKRYDALRDSVKRTFMDTLPGTKRIVNEEQQLKTALSELESKVTLLSGGGNVKVVDMLREITTRTPPALNFRVTRMRIDDDEIKLEGETADFEGVEKIKSALGKSPLFNTVEVGGAKASRLENIVEFQLNIKLAG